MANMVNIDKSATSAAADLATAITMIRNGIGKLKGLDGFRKQSIGVNAALMQTNFGVESEAQATDLSNRWAAFFTAYDGGTITAFSDFVDAMKI
jgi:hypothetical protein